MTGGFNKTGWHWTRKGWKRSPKHCLSVKKVPSSTKCKTRKKVRITPAAPSFAKARELAAEQGRAVSAPIPAPPAFAGAGSAEKAAQPLPRRAWSGKYADLLPEAATPSKGES